MSHYIPQRQSDYIFLKARQCGTSRRQELFEMMPKLAEIYRTNPTAHIVLNILERYTDEEQILDLLEQIVMQNIDFQNMLTKAIEQGFRPQIQKTESTPVIEYPKVNCKENWNPDWKGDPDDENRWKGW